MGKTPYNLASIAQRNYNIELRAKKQMFL